MDGDTLRMYCCGPTVYGPAHIGNFRTFVMQDVFRRVLEVGGVKVRHVRNITDVDDKTIARSQEEKRSLNDFTAGWTEKFHADEEALNILSPHVEPSAVDHIPEQIEMIQDLVDKSHAYRAEDGSVYFDVSSFPDYGKLSRLKERSITTNNVERETSDEYERESAADFVLWKARREEDGPNYWESPWGQGRPGWHLECSAMCKKHLGDTFDVHSGGVDLLFPHHENEIAQSECCSGETFVKHWFHITHLMVDNAKMSKSLGNLYTLADLEEKGFTAEELRYVLLSGSYRQPLNFTLDSLHAAQKALSKLRDLKEKIGLDDSVENGEENFGPFGPVLEALQADMNTPAALGKLFTAAKELQSAELTEDELAAARSGFGLAMRAFGFRLEAPEEAGGSDVPEEIQALAQQRWDAKQNKDWGAADALRDQVQAAGYQIEDQKDGFIVVKG
ncbi:MAG: cysteine--tRNA ligase [Verrucomicrobiota bacterium]